MSTPCCCNCLLQEGDLNCVALSEIMHLGLITTKIFVNQFVQTGLGGGRSKGIKFNISRKYIVAFKNVTQPPFDVGKLPYISMANRAPGFSRRYLSSTVNGLLGCSHR